jgi:membrane-associated phospholipid phosphatase
MIGIFAPYLSLKIICVVYTLWVWWAAVYLNHHFLVDLLGGAFYTFISYYIGMALLYYLSRMSKDWMYSPAAFKFLKFASSDELESDFELLEIDEGAFVKQQDHSNSSKSSA